MPNVLLGVLMIIAAIVKYIVVPIIVACLAVLCIFGLQLLVAGTCYVAGKALQGVFHGMHKVSVASKLITIPLSLALAAGTSVLLFFTWKVPVWMVCVKLEKMF